jgi:hypothetical protein
VQHQRALDNFCKQVIAWQLLLLLLLLLLCTAVERLLATYCHISGLGPICRHSKCHVHWPEA